jgi:hypothetical protein
MENVSWNGRLQSTGLKVYETWQELEKDQVNSFILFRFHFWHLQDNFEKPSYSEYQNSHGSVS